MIQNILILNTQSKRVKVYLNVCTSQYSVGQMLIMLDNHVGQYNDLFSNPLANVTASKLSNVILKAVPVYTLFVRMM